MEHAWLANRLVQGLALPAPVGELRSERAGSFWSALEPLWACAEEPFLRQVHQLVTRRPVEPSTLLAYQARLKFLQSRVLFVHELVQARPKLAEQFAQHVPSFLLQPDTLPRLRQAVPALLAQPEPRVFVQSVYFHLLGRLPFETEVRPWLRWLQPYSLGKKKYLVQLALCSVEHARQVVLVSYRTYLQREPGEAEIARELPRLQRWPRLGSWWFKRTLGRSAERGRLLIRQAYQAQLARLPLADEETAWLARWRWWGAWALRRLQAELRRKQHEESAYILPFPLSVDTLPLHEGESRCAS